MGNNDPTVDADKHEYYLDGKLLDEPSVTTILRGVGIIKPDYFTELAGTEWFRNKAFRHGKK